MKKEVLYQDLLLGLCKNQHKLPPPHPPQQRSRRMIIQQLSFPHPPPLPMKEPLPPLLQQHNNKMIQIIEPHPLSLHPQFVAAKSLISDLQINVLQYSVCVEGGWVTNNLLKF